MLGIRTNISQSSFSWSRYWTTHLFGVGDLSVRATGRSGNKIPASIGNDVDILLPHYANGDHLGMVHNDAGNVFEVGTTDLTIAAWCRSETTDVPSVWYKIIGKAAFAVVGGYGWGILNDGHFNFFYKTTTSGNQYVVTTVNAMDQEWHFLLAKINVATKIIQLYIDDVKCGNDISYTGDWSDSNLQFKIAGEPNSGEYPSPFDFSDMYVYRSVLSVENATNLYNHIEVAGALAHWGGVVANPDVIFDLSGNDYHLTSGQDPYTDIIGYDKNGFRAGLENGYVLYSNGVAGRRYIPNKDDTSELTYSEASWFKVRSIPAQANYHNLFDSYLDMNSTSYDRSNITNWSVKARDASADGFYDSTNPDKWHVTEIQRFNLQYWANTGYDGLCFCKGSLNSFSLNTHMIEIYAYTTNKSADEIKNIVRYTGDFEAELLLDSEFSDTNSYNIWWHAWHHFTFTGGKANYDGTSGAETGVLRQYLRYNYVIGRKYLLSYKISDLSSNNAHFWLTGNSNFPFGVVTWDKTAGIYSVELTCAEDSDYFFEMQAGITGANDGQFSFDYMSFKIVE